ncbi:hypothetical protein DEIPH_ctg050orf0014 [Deinococcus phoenicis]|uniref:Cytochrome b561 domain-containing protein n=1 Tax=Deinococcus phoenicis TaxID=1476583 RepID=A0A016QLZ6_9DEIO|nr:hypothetical protein [Deinococcus phoenicis]EYB67165.1 hypothetical protein DEIPH_ctg050orf0014 [Deinococcus phoenicis]
MSTLYVILLTLHNLTRWLVLLAGVWALLRSFRGVGGVQTFTPTDRSAVSMFMSSLHLQVVLGLLLFAFLGMQKIPVFAGAPRPSFQWEHLGLGLLAAVFATVGNAVSKRAEGNQAKFRAASLWTVLSLLAVLLAIPWWRPLLRLFA